MGMSERNGIRRVRGGLAVLFLALAVSAAPEVAPSSASPSSFSELINMPAPMPNTMIIKPAMIRMTGGISMLLLG